MALTTVNPGLLDGQAQYTGFKNRIINGAMMIDQRNAGASVTTTSATSGNYSVDRWQFVCSQNSKFTIQQNAGSVTPPSGFTKYVGLTSSSAYSVAAGDYFGVRQAIEGLNVADLGWGSANASAVTFSFWVRSSLTGAFGGSFENAAGDRSYPFSYTINSANTWEQKTITVAGDTTGTWATDTSVGIRIMFSIGAGSTWSGTAGAWSSTRYFSATGATSVVGTNGATFYITGVQLEKGSTATSFDYRPYGTELALCQRYYEKSFAMAYAIGSGAAATTRYGGSPTTGLAGTTGYIVGSLSFIVPKRASPTLTLYDAAGTANAVVAEQIGASSTNGNAVYTVSTNEFGSIVGRDGASGTRTSTSAFSYSYTAAAEL